MSVGSAWSRTREGHGRRGRRRLPALTSGSPWRSSQPRLRTGVGHRGLGHPLRPGSEETLVRSPAVLAVLTCCSCPATPPSVIVRPHSQPPAPIQKGGTWGVCPVGTKATRRGAGPAWPRRGAAFGGVRSLLVNLRGFLGHNGVGDRTHFFAALRKEHRERFWDRRPVGLGRDLASGELLAP